ncbi:hypothetical protein ACFLVW_03135 [Chloroflexota bacterium]
MWKLKSCPRCRGDIYIDKELYGWYELCLQCGYLREMPGMAEAHQHSNKERKEEPVKLHS